MGSCRGSWDVTTVVGTVDGRVRTQNFWTRVARTGHRGDASPPVSLSPSYPPTHLPTLLLTSLPDGPCEQTSETPHGTVGQVEVRVGSREGRTRCRSRTGPLEPTRVLWGDMDDARAGQDICVSTRYVSDSGPHRPRTYHHPGPTTLLVPSPLLPVGLPTTRVSFLAYVRVVLQG